MYIESSGEVISVSILSRTEGIGTYWCELTDGKYIFSRSKSQIYETKEEAQKDADKYNNQKYRKTEIAEALQVNNNLPFIKKK